MVNDLSSVRPLDDVNCSVHLNLPPWTNVDGWFVLTACRACESRYGSIDEQPCFVETSCGPLVGSLPDGEQYGTTTKGSYPVKHE